MSVFTGMIDFTGAGKANSSLSDNLKALRFEPWPKILKERSQALYQLSYTAKLLKVEDFG